MLNLKKMLMLGCAITSAITFMPQSAEAKPLTSLNAATTRDKDNIVTIAPGKAGKVWNAQWNLFNDGINEGEYKIRVELKIVDPKQGKGIRFGVYGPKLGTALLKFIKTTDIPAKAEFQWVDVGTVTVKKDIGAYFYTCGAGDDSYSKYFVKTVEFNKVK